MTTEEKREELKKRLYAILPIITAMKMQQSIERGLRDPEYNAEVHKHAEEKIKEYLKKKEG